MTDIARADLSWMDTAICAKDDSLLPVFFPEIRKGVRTNYMPAQKICMHCPVRLPCAAYSVFNNIPTGVWGGMTPGQRRLVRSNPTLVAKLRRAVRGGE